MRPGQRGPPDGFGVTQTAQVTAAVVAFVWLGMVLAISFLETPLKFRAPGITLPLGLGIGRLVFRALNLVEVALAGLLVVCGLLGALSTAGWWLLTGICATLGAQMLVLRPRLDRRVAQLVAGDAPAPSRQHLVYIALEVAKVVALPTLGVLLFAQVLP